MIYLFSALALIGSIIPAIVVRSVKFYIRIAIISPGVIITLILFAFGKNKIILIKDTSNKKVIIKLINYLYFPKMKFNLDIENTHFCVKTKNDVNENTTRLFIINDYKNLSGIDLDEINIKQKPAKFYILLLISVLENIMMNNLPKF